MAKETPHPTSVAGFCARHGIARGTFYNLVKRGELVPTKIGARTVIQPADEKAWLDACRGAPLLERGKPRKEAAE